MKDLLGKVLQADKIIHEQQLGLYWYPPNEEQVNAAFKEARERAKSMGKKKAAEHAAQGDSLQVPPSRSIDGRARRLLDVIAYKWAWLMTVACVADARGGHGEGCRAHRPGRLAPGASLK